MDGVGYQETRTRRSFRLELQIEQGKARLSNAQLRSGPGQRRVFEVALGRIWTQPTKRMGSCVGIPFWMYYILRSAAEVRPVERGWINQAILEDGEMPPVNQVPRQKLSILSQ